MSLWEAAFQAFLSASRQVDNQGALYLQHQPLGFGW